MFCWCLHKWFSKCTCLLYFCVNQILRIGEVYQAKLKKRILVQLDLTFLENMCLKRPNKYLLNRSYCFLLCLLCCLNNFKRHLQRIFEKKKKKFKTRICENRIFAVSDYCLQNQLKFYNFIAFYQEYRCLNKVSHQIKKIGPILFSANFILVSLCFYLDRGKRLFV